MTAGLFNSMFNLGNLLAPLIAGSLHDWGGYRFTTDTMSIVSLIYLGGMVFVMTKIKEGKNKWNGGLNNTLVKL